MAIKRSNKTLQEWLKQFPDESTISIEKVIKDDGYVNGAKLVLTMPNGQEWVCSNDFLQ